MTRSGEAPQDVTGEDDAPVRLVRVTNTRESVDALLALAEAGRSALPVHPRLTGAEVARMRRHLPASPPDPAAPFGGRAPRLVVATSGSTGEPKLITHAWPRLLEAARLQARHLGFGRGGVWATPLPVCSVGGLMVPLRAVAAGGAYHLWRRWEPERALRDVAARGVTHLSLTPHMMADLMERRPPESLECVLLGGAPSAHLVPEARDRGWPVAPGYGATEGPATLAVLAPDAEDAGDGSYGPPLPHVELRAGEPGAPAPLAFRSPVSALGRLLRGREVPVGDGGWIAPGDAGWLDAAGRLHVAGRRDRGVLVGGMTVDPVEVERALLGHAGVRDAAVVALPHPRLTHVLGAAVEPTEPGAVDAPALRAHLEARLAPPKRPKRVRVLPALPRGATGKVDREALAGLLGE